ncbi:hypothetical protein I204_01897 [Kwoniella mangroviensis CBS 8886]|nr:uncharacterized protein I203_03796 [Kwoniella mangroviensis CBS 8507]OCF67111.1 hypothetical protein I203_03796 [Kwoniella mangroviensis CBS 8507]OCF77894.1 hypothetical protein I204_01897 [Kwoniella mangroviensis CBS 8886]
MQNAERLQKHFMRRMPPSRRFEVHVKTISEVPPASRSDSALTRSIGEKVDSHEASQGHPKSPSETDPEKKQIEPGSDQDETPRLRLGEPNPEHIKLYGKKKAKKIAYDQLAIEDDKEYDMSLWRAIYFSLSSQYWTAVVLSIAGRSKQCLSFSIGASETIGIIGRTGAGKSSVAQALFRIVEIDKGEIEVDGVDLRELGLETLRSRLAIIPQDAFLFAGTIRHNLDPTSSRTDAELNDALNLIRNHPRVSITLKDKLKLDSSVAAEGANFSAGEKQLLSLIRVLSRRCKILLLDEATSSVEPETDALIQGIIQTEFSDITLLSIAHRLQTVAYYDRILVLDKGQVREFDTPLTLFDQKNSIFRDLCDKKRIRREELLEIQEEAKLAKLISE